MATNGCGTGYWTGHRAARYVRSVRLDNIFKKLATRDLEKIPVVDVDAAINRLLTQDFNRRLFQSTNDLPTSIPPTTADAQIRNQNIPPKWYSTSTAILRSTTNMDGVVYENGEVCISILHPPEEDKYGYESASERWSPVQTPETILLSVISMLSSPNDESPANVEAGSLWRNDPKEFKKRVRRCVRDSQENAWD